MKYIVFLTLIFSTFLFTQETFAQAKIEFKKTAHDFGEVKEGDKATYTFEFTNVGNAPLILSNVRPSCGCTSPSWSRDPIAPGKTGQITATYNSLGRPGNFHKSIQVTSNAENNVTTVYIKGSVIRKENQSSTISPALTEASLVTSPSSYHFGRIELGSPQKHSFSLKNTGNQPIIIEHIKAGCNCISYTLSKQQIGPGQIINLDIVYTPREKGMVEDKVIITVRDKRPLELKLSAEVLESLQIKSPVQQQNTFIPFK